jgi:hypothetical protein
MSGLDRKTSKIAARYSPYQAQSDTRNPARQAKTSGIQGEISVYRKAWVENPAALPGALPGALRRYKYCNTYGFGVCKPRSIENFLSDDRFFAEKSETPRHCLGHCRGVVHQAS